MISIALTLLQEKGNKDVVVAVWHAQGMTVDSVGIAWT